MTGECIRRGLTTWAACRCEPCKVSNRRLAKLARLGRLHRIPPEVGMAILQQMADSGWTAPAIASATGVSENTVSNWLAKIRNGRTFKLGPAACQQLVHAGRPTEGFVGTEIPRRMLRALARIGWGCGVLTDRLRAKGHTIGGATLDSIRGGRTARVHTWLANAITDLFLELELQPRESRQTVGFAIAEGWPGPFAWDEDTLYDPHARPRGIDPRRAAAVIDDAAIERVIAGDRNVKLYKGETEEVVRRLIAAGVTTNVIRNDYGIKAERYIKVGDRQQAAA